MLLNNGQSCSNGLHNSFDFYVQVQTVSSYPSINNLMMMLSELPSHLFISWDGMIVINRVE